MSSKISVIMSVYNESEKELRTSIESILNQTYKNFEFIIILDNPESENKKIIESYNDDRIKFYINENNIGLPKSLNKALEYVSGKYVARMDADDISLKNRFEEQIKYLQDNNLDLCGAGIEYFDEDKSYEKIIYPSNYNDIKEVLKYLDCVPHPTWFGKKEVFDKNNGYCTLFKTAQDYEFITRAVLNGFKIGNVPKILLKYRLSKAGLSRKKAGMQELNADIIKEKYKHGKTIDMLELEKYYNSKKYIKKLEKYNNFYAINKTRVDAKKEKHIFKYLLYSFFTIIHVKLFIKTMKHKKMMKKYVIIK